MAKKVTITWTDPSPTTNVDHLEIWRKTGIGGTYAQIGTDISLAAANSYEDTNSGAGLTDGTTYYYQVRAYAADGTTYEEVEGNITISSVATYELYENFENALDVTPVTGDWIFTNHNVTDVVFVKNSSDMTITANTTIISFAENVYQSIKVLPVTGTVIVAVDITCANTRYAGMFWGIGREGALAADYFAIYPDLGSSSVMNLIGAWASGGNLTGIAQTQILTTKTSMRLILTSGTSIEFQVWDGAVWVSKGTGTAITGCTGNATAFFTARGAAVNTGSITYDNIVLTDTLYSTRYPV